MKNKRYIVFKLFAQHKFGNKVIFESGEILLETDSIDILIDYMFCPNVFSYAIETTSYEATYEWYKKQMETQFELIGSTQTIELGKHSEDLDKLYHDKFGENWLPIKYIVVDTNHKNVNPLYLKFIKKIKILTKL